LSTAWDGQPPCGQLNPSNDHTYEVVDGVLRFSSSIFFDNLLHLGFDEVNEQCWETSPELQQWMIENGIEDNQALLQYHANRLLNITQPLNREPVFWQEAFDEVRVGKCLGSKYTVRVLTGCMRAESSC